MTVAPLAGATLCPGALVGAAVGIGLVALALRRRQRDRALLALGFGMILSNVSQAAGVPVLSPGFAAGPDMPSAALDYLYLGLVRGFYPALLFLCLGAASDLSALLVRPRLLLVAAVGQVGILATLAGALWVGLVPAEAACTSLASVAGGAAALFLGSGLAPQFLPALAVGLYLAAALAALVQPPIMLLCTSRADRQIKSAPLRAATRVERVVFPVAGCVVGAAFAPRAAPLLGLFFLGNLLRESGLADRLASGVRTTFAEAVGVLLALTAGLGATGGAVLDRRTLAVFFLSVAGFALATALGVLAVKAGNLVAREKLNPLLGAAGVSTLPESARLVQLLASREDPTGYLLPQAAGLTGACLVSSALAAGVLWKLFGV